MSTDAVIRLARGDITTFRADAIVNAANSQLAVGGGACGAIHRARGRAIEDECRRYVAANGPVPEGGAAMTTAGELPARCVVHAVGPVWTGGGGGEAETLADAYRSAVALADEAGLRTLAFPSISTGIFGYPVDLAARVALGAVRDALDRARCLREVTFVLFGDATYAAFEHALADVARPGTDSGTFHP